MPRKKQLKKWPLGCQRSPGSRLYTCMLLLTTLRPGKGWDEMINEKLPIFGERSLYTVIKLKNSLINYHVRYIIDIFRGNLISYFFPNQINYSITPVTLVEWSCIVSSSGLVPKVHAYWTLPTPKLNVFQLLRDNMDHLSFF